MATRLQEDRVRDLAIAYGIAANVVAFADDGAAAAKVAADIGRPVAVKLVAADVVHKSKAGGVLLDVDPDDVAARTEEMLATHRARGAQVAGVTVEAMVDPGLEVVVGGLRTPGFGAVVMFGHGGVDIEQLDDVTFALAPLTRGDAERMVSRTRIGRAVGLRLPARVPDLVAQLMAVGGPDGMLMCEPITEIDLNPVIVSPDRVVAVDARATALDAPASGTPLPDPAACFAALRPAIYPESVAVLGASADPRKMGNRAVRSLLEFGFTGSLHPVSRTSTEILGVPTVASIDDLPMGIDRAVVALPAAAVPHALDALARRGTRTAHVLTAGTPRFDVGLHKQGLRVIGPNCIGHYAPASGITMIAPTASEPRTGTIAVVSQSGTYAGDVVRRGFALGLQCSFVSSVGNCEDVTPAELLAFCEADPSTSAVAFYLEGDVGASAFFRFAATMTKPVVLLKGGRTAVGGVAAASHTGALASDPRLLHDVAEQTGVLLVEDLDQLLDTLVLLQSSPTIDGDGLGLLGSGGGVAVVGADSADDWGLQVPTLGATALAALAPYSAPGASLTNPVDIPVWSLFDNTGAHVITHTGPITEAVATDEQVAVLCAFLDLGTFYDMYDPDQSDDLVELLINDLIAAPRRDKPLTLVLRSSGDQHQDDLARDLRTACGNHGVPVFDSVDRAIAAIGGIRWLTRHGKGLRNEQR